MRPKQQQVVLLVERLTTNLVTEKMLYIAPWCLQMVPTLHKMEIICLKLNKRQFQPLNWLLADYEHER